MAAFIDVLQIGATYRPQTTDVEVCHLLRQQEKNDPKIFLPEGEKNYDYQVDNIAYLIMKNMIYYYNINESSSLPCT